MQRILGRYSEYVYAILRIVVGFTFLLHGTQKFFAYPPLPPTMPAQPLNTLMTIAGGLEIVCGLLVLVGLFASVAAFIVSGEMAVAYFMVHQPRGVWPTTNGGDAAVLFCFIFLYIAAKGSGLWSVDSLRGAPSTNL
jgi:putative oxidoreductase